MASDLAKQLRDIQQKDQIIGGPSQSGKTRASFLFDPKEAANFDADSIYALGLEGLSELQQMDPIFLKYQPVLFSSQSLDLDRALLTAEENAQIDDQISSFLKYLSPYFLQKCAHKTLEWLIRKYRINELNVEDLIGCILPFHESVPFVRMVQILYFQDKDRWGFLFDVKKNAKLINRTYLAQRCIADRSILNFVFETAQWHAEESSLKKKNAHIIPFFTYLCMNYIHLVKRMELTHVAHLIPFVLASIKMRKSPDFQLAGYMIFMQLMERISLSPQTISEIVTLSAKNCADTIISECILFISKVFQVYPSCSIPAEVFENLAKAPTIVRALEKSSNSYEIKFFIDQFLKIVQEPDFPGSTELRRTLEIRASHVH